MVNCHCTATEPFHSFWVTRTTRQCCGLEEVNLCRARGWGLTLLCKLWVKEMWGLPTLLSVRLSVTWELCQGNVLLAFMEGLMFIGAYHNLYVLDYNLIKAVIFLDMKGNEHKQTLQYIITHYTYEVQRRVVIY